MIKKEIPNPHYLVLDTNILRAKDDAELVSTKLTSFLDIYAAEFQVFLVIPDVVRDEILYQEGKKAISQLNAASSSFKKINAITKKDYSYRLTEATIRKCLATNFKKWIESHCGNILNAPTDNIDLSDIIKRSVWRLPPFDNNPKNGEKGFRDMMILETLRYHLATCAHSYPIAFICNDKLLRETAQEELEGYENLSVYESLEDFESYLKLTKQHLEEKFIRTIARRATVKFFSNGDLSSLYYRENVADSIFTDYRSHFDNPLLSEEKRGLPDPSFDSTDHQWSESGSRMEWVYSAQFLESPAEKEYIWLSRVICIRQYGQHRKPNLGLVAEPPPEKRLLKLEFDVKWQARITDNARFMRMELIDISLSNGSFKPPTIEDISEFDLIES